jgi:hypothetical protein
MIPAKEDRDHLMKWSATLIAMPHIRMSCGILLVSEEQGVGKTTFAEKIMMPLVGKHNTSFPSAQEATQERFTSWRLFKRLAVIAELHDGDTAKAYNRLKAAITDDWIRCEEKYEKAFDVKSFIHITASSNSLRALKLSRADRRWFMPGVTEQKRPHQEWVELNAWLEAGGLEAISYWAHDFVKAHGHVPPGVEAPDSIMKNQSIVASMSDGEKLIYYLGSNLAELNPKQVVRLDELRIWLAGKKSADRQYGDTGAKLLETAETISRVLRHCGLKVLGKQFKAKGERFRVAANFDIDANATWADLEPLCLPPSKLDDKAKDDELM